MDPRRFLVAAAALLSACSGPVNAPEPRSSAPPSSPPTARWERLRALGYVSRAPVRRADRDKQGVTRHAATLSYPGLNLYTSRPHSEAYLVDMRGNRHHTWSSDVGQPRASEELLPFLHGWQHAELGPDGGLFVIVSRHLVMRLDPASRVVWKARVAAHHDLALAAGGDVLTITDELRRLMVGSRPRLLIDNEIVTLTAAGSVRRRLSLLDVLTSSAATAGLVLNKIEERFSEIDRIGLKRSLERQDAERLLGDPRLPELAAALERDAPLGNQGRSTISLLRQIPDCPPDVLHTNSVEIVERRIPGVCEEGDLLLAVRDLDLIAIVDPTARRLRWSWGPGVLDRPHRPSLTESGNMLLFDNGPSRGWTRIVELDPSRRRIVWSHEGQPPAALFSPTMGACQELPNGNVLITVSTSGRVLELTRDGRVAWEFFNPDIDPARRSRGVIPDMRRLPQDVARALRRGPSGHAEPDHGSSDGL